LQLLDTHCWLWAQLGQVDRLSRWVVSALRNAEAAGNLRVTLHGDPADHIIVATARACNATLLTKDQRLIEYSHQRHVRVLEA